MFVWPPCCDVLRHVGCCWLKFENGQIWANNTQHVATCRNRVVKRTQHVAPNNVAICWVAMLRSFGRGFRKYVIMSWTEYIFLWLTASLKVGLLDKWLVDTMDGGKGRNTIILSCWDLPEYIVWTPSMYLLKFQLNLFICLFVCLFV